MEFDAEYLGQNSDCPHCGQSTTLRPPIIPEKKERKWIAPLIRISIALAVVLIVAVILREISKVPNLATDAGGIVYALLMLGCGLVAIYLAVLWLVFPWLVLSKFNQLIEEVRKLRKHQ
jgi:hypothetical protein